MELRRVPAGGGWRVLFMDLSVMRSPSGDDPARRGAPALRSGRGNREKLKPGKIAGKIKTEEKEKGRRLRDALSSALAENWSTPQSSENSVALQRDC
jgi:hypothetical protein